MKKKKKVVMDDDDEDEVVSYKSKKYGKGHGYGDDDAEYHGYHGYHGRHSLGRGFMDEGYLLDLAEKLEDKHEVP